MTTNLTGRDYQQLQRALISAFPRRADLEQMLLFQLGESLDAIVASGNLAETTFSLVQWAVARGRLADLIAGAREANPGNADLRAFAEQVGRAQWPSPAQPTSPPAAPAEREHLQGLLATQQGNLRKLENEEAKYGGLGVPLSLLNQLDDVRREIARLEGLLKDLPSQAPATSDPATPPAGNARPTARRRDSYTSYEIALAELLRRLGPRHDRYAEALTYQQRLSENIDESRRYGDTEGTRAQRARIIGELNGMALDELGMAFNELM
jgi:hypothetical protein